MGQPGQTSRRWLLLAGTAAVCIASTGCNRRLLALFFDVPPKAEEAAPAAELLQTPVEFELLFPPEDTIRPEIEQFLFEEADTVAALLPKDHAGNIDWMEALRQSVIRPRSGLVATPQALSDPDPFRFAFDFYFPGPTETFDAYFPHSAHTEWVDCRQCHGRIFKYQGTEIKMADVFQGKYCGECHGRVAFPVATACERCHVTLPQPADRARPELLGTFRIPRTEVEVPAPAATTVPDSLSAPDSAAVTDSAADSAADSAVVVAPPPSAFRLAFPDLPEAQFPHWVHRIRYRCKTCHVAIFEPELGANNITMAAISDGEFCGKCHDGKTAFAAGFGECQRCHVDPVEAAASPPGG